MSTKIKAGTATSGAVVDADATGILELQSGSTPTTAVTIDASQNVGIGTTTALLTSSGRGNLTLNGSTDSLMAFGSGGTAYGYINATTSAFNISAYQSSTPLVFLTNGGERMRIDSSGNVGIGYSSLYSPSKFQVQVSSGQGIFYRSGTFGSSEITFATNGLAAYATGTIGASDLKFNIGGTQAVTIDSSGNFLVGTTSSANPPSQGVANFGGQSNSQIGIGHANGTGGGQYYLVFGYNGGAIGGVTQNGTTQVLYLTSSDYRLKENVAPITGALDRVSKLKPVTYSWKNTDNEVGEGFIAHELQEVCPLAVNGEKDAVNEDGSIKAQGIDTAKIVSLLTAAIQEQQAIITQLQADVAALKGAK
jgi:hypothetical protein